MVCINEMVWVTYRVFDDEKRTIDSDEVLQVDGIAVAAGILHPYFCNDMWENQTVIPGRWERDEWESRERDEWDMYGVNESVGVQVNQ